MSSVEEKIYELLSGDSAVAALVGSRIYPLALPQNPTFPAATYFRVGSDKRDYSFTGPSKMADARFQIDVWSATYAGAKGLTDAIRNVLSGYSGTVGIQIHGAFLDSDRDFFEEINGKRVYRVSSDYIFSIYEP